MTVAGREGAVASETAYATEAGIEMLRRGGSAADAIIATQLCVGVVQSSVCSSGLSHASGNAERCVDAIVLNADVRHWWWWLCTGPTAFWRV